MMEGKANADGSGWTSGWKLRVEANESTACGAGADAMRPSGTRCSDATSEARTLGGCNMVTAPQLVSLDRCPLSEPEVTAAREDGAGHDARRTMAAKVASSDGDYAERKNLQPRRIYKMAASSGVELAWPRCIGGRLPAAAGFAGGPRTEDAKI